MVSSVEEKMMMTEPAPMRKNDNNKVVRKLGMTGGEIKRMGKSNQKIKRKMG